MDDVTLPLGVGHDQYEPRLSWLELSALLFHYPAIPPVALYTKRSLAACNHVRIYTNITELSYPLDSFSKGRITL